MKVLEIIGAAALETADLWLAIATSPYGSSYSRILRQKERIKQARDEIISELKERQSLYDLIRSFKRDGLIMKKVKGKKSFWLLTKKGEKELKKLKTYYGKNNLPQRKYESIASDKLTIIAFDIPEKEKHKRNWLRRKLQEMNFQKLQESVWVGKYMVPEEFVEDLNFCRLLPHVEIFTVNKAGTLKKLPLWETVINEKP
jgi:DNA-binding transcriptional regulator PaaX